MMEAVGILRRGENSNVKDYPREKTRALDLEKVVRDAWARLMETYGVSVGYLMTALKWDMTSRAEETAGVEEEVKGKNCWHCGRRQ